MHRRVGPRLQGEYRRHARGTEPRADRRPCRGGRWRARVRPGGRRRSEAHLRAQRRGDDRAERHRGGRRGGRARHRHRMAGVPQPGLRGREKAAEDPGHLRRPQSLRSRRAACAGPGVLPDRQKAVKALDTSKARVLVVGDVMLDRYWYGDVSRISPEAPVPVVLVNEKKEDLRLGGAATVAHNCAALGASPSLLSVVGNDDAGRTLEKLLKRNGVQANLHRDRSIRTTEKLRVIGRQQQLLRMDFERSPSREVLASKLTQYRAALPECDVVILSDYGKGGMTHIAQMIQLARRAKKRVLVDPKGDDYSRYRGASIITPNRAELREVVGTWQDEADLSRRAETLRRTLGLEALLVTRGEEGMTLFRAGRKLHFKTEAREVFDVTGAGDTVIAGLAVMLGAGANLDAAVKVANRAAGIVVGKLGTAVATRAEVFA